MSYPEEVLLSMKSKDGTFRRDSMGHVSDADAASFCSSPSSVRVRLRNTFLDFRDDGEMPYNEGSDSPRDGLLDGGDNGSTAMSPLRRSQSDCIGVDQYIRQRLGSNAGLPIEHTELEEDTGYSQQGRLSPIGALANKPRDACGVSILSFSPPTFQASPFVQQQNSQGAPSSDFVMVMEEDPPQQFMRPPSISASQMHSSVSTQPGTPQQISSSRLSGAYSNRSSVIEDKTTVMLRNIPNKYTQRMLLDQLNRMGYEGKYDFFYLPIDFRNRCNVGYAFINFLSNETATQFKKQLDGFRLTGFNSQKICEVSFARVQGLKANIQHYRNSPVNGIAISEYRPLLFSNGEEIPFPIVAKTDVSYS